jgi:hypothetical protein
MGDCSHLRLLRHIRLLSLAKKARLRQLFLVRASLPPTYCHYKEGTCRYYADNAQLTHQTFMVIRIVTKAKRMRCQAQPCTRILLCCANTRCTE